MLCPVIFSRQLILKSCFTRKTKEKKDFRGCFFTFCTQIKCKIANYFSLKKKNVSYMLTVTHSMFYGKLFRLFHIAKQ